MSSGKSGKPSGSTSTTTQTSDPVIRDMLGRVQSNLNTNYYGGLGAAIPGMSSDTTDAMNRIRGISTNGGYGAVDNANRLVSGLIGDPSHSSSMLGQNLSSWAQGNFANSPGYSGLLQTANGSFLPGQKPSVSAGPPGSGIGVTMSSSGNPYADSLATAAANNAQGAVNSSFNAGGRFGSGANMSGLVQNVSQATNSILSPIYQQERANQINAQGLLGQAQGTAATTLGSQQLQAAGMAPALDSAQYIDPTMQQGIGQFQDQYNASLLNQPGTALKNAFGLVSGNGGSTTTQPYFTNPLAGILGGATGGAGLYNSLFGNKSGSGNSGIGEDGGFFGRLFGGGGNSGFDPNYMNYGGGSPSTAAAGGYGYF